MNGINDLGLGTAAIGRPQYINIRQESTSSFDMEAFRQQGIAVLNAAYEQGVRYFDTAPGYGLAEQMLLDWVINKKEVDIEVATKWGYTYVANFDHKATLHEVKEHSLAKLNEQWAYSKNLLPYLTTYQIHSATLETGVLDNKPILERLAELKNEYDLRIGLTSTGANQLNVLEKAMDIKVEGKLLFDAFQVTYNMFDQSLANLATTIAAADRRIIVKEALANGRIFPNERYPHYQEAYKKLNILSEKYKVGLDAIALRFCIDSIPAYKVLSGAAITTHLEENIQATRFTLEQEDIDSLKKLSIAPEQYWQERKQLGWN